MHHLGKCSYLLCCPASSGVTSQGRLLISTRMWACSHIQVHSSAQRRTISTRRFLLPSSCSLGDTRLVEIISGAQSDGARRSGSVVRFSGPGSVFVAGGRGCGSAGVAGGAASRAQSQRGPAG